MDTNPEPIPEDVETIARQVIGAACDVSNELGAGFLEKVYENALAEELRLRGIPAVTKKRLVVRYKGVVVGDYSPDLLVDQRVIVELKCAQAIGPEHVAQCLNYLKATGIRRALLINCQRPRVEVRRVVL